jgi:hypothetical protein
MLPFRKIKGKKQQKRIQHMVICPIALAVHCKGCPLVKFCPAKSILGDYGKEAPDTPKNETGEEKQTKDESTK